MWRDGHMSWRLLIAFLSRFSNRQAALSAPALEKEAGAAGKAVCRTGGAR
jgi:hypothetical protein